MKKGVEVKASPLNAVKLDLALILVMGVLLFFVIGTVVTSVWIELLVLFLYGIAAMAWVVSRTRRVVSQLRDGQQSESNEATG